MQSTDTTLQPQQVTSPTAASRHYSVNQQVMDQFTQMRSMLSSLRWQKHQTTTCTVFCNYLALEVLEEKDFQTFKNEAVKLLSNIQSKAEECGRQPQQPQQQKLSQRIVSKTFQQPQQRIHLNHPRDPQARSSNPLREYILTIPETLKPGHPTHPSGKQSRC